MSEMLHRRCEHLVLLRDDWDSYGTAAPSAQAIAIASELLKLLDALGVECSVFPHHDGGVSLESLKGPELYIANDGHIVAGVDT